MEAIEYKNMYEVEEDHFWFVGMRGITKVLLDKVMTKKDIDILDAGCGTGGNLIFLQKYGRVSGVDISEYAINCCQKRGFQNVKVGSVDKLPFSDHSFDLVTVFDVISDNGVKDPKGVLSEAYRVLKPQGSLLVRVAAYKWLWSVHDVKVGTGKRFSSPELNNLLTDCGFKPIRITYACTLLFPVALLRRLQGKFLPGTIKSSDIRPFPRAINYFFKLPFLLEAFLIKYINLPFGLSVVAIAKRKE